MYYDMQQFESIDHQLTFTYEDSIERVEAIDKETLALWIGLAGLWESFRSLMNGYLVEQQLGCLILLCLESLPPQIELKRGSLTWKLVQLKYAIRQDKVLPWVDASVRQ